MRNYVIINGVNSNTINGLAINELPPITKPPMRVLQEEIDGRDGDITTNLGYGAYDKVMTIGLFHTFDINQIIAFFNGTGTIVFSNEPDKKYNYKIIDQIDYEKLISFKTATVTLHCQPFKYPLEETPLIIEPTIDTLENVTSASIETNENTLSTTLKGNTSQDGEPTPSNPIPINVVTGDNTIKVVGKNLFDGETETGMYDSNGAKTTGSGLINKNMIRVSPSTTYKISNDGSGMGINILSYKSDKTYIGAVSYQANETFTTSSDTYYINFWRANNLDSIKIQLEKGNAISPYKPYQSQTYPIYLGANLPSNYTKVEYIQSSGTQYIDTNYKPTTNDRVECSMEYTTLSNQSIYGTYSGDVLEVFGNSVTNMWEYRDNTAWVSSTSSTSANTKYDVEFYYGRSNQYLKVNNEIVVSSTHSFTNATSSINAYIFGRNNNNSVQANAYIKLYSMKIYSNEVLVRNFIPCYRNSDNEIGLYDLVNNTFYTNAGTETFAKGNDIPNGIELCKIGDYQDYIYKDNDSWYLHKEIGKVVLDGTGDWYTSSGTTQVYYGGGVGYIQDTTKLPCNISSNCQMPNTNIYFYNTGLSLADFKTLLGTTNAIVYGRLTTPTNTIITDTELIEQLDNLMSATTYYGITNINQQNNDLPFIMDLSYMEKDTDKVIVDNTGNIYSKPTIALEGNGTGGIYLNDNQILSVELTDKMTISISDMEAFDPDTHALLNRNVTGNYNSMTLQPNENTIKITGGITKATITDYTRWL